MTVSECCLIKLLSCTSILFEKYIDILALEMTSSGNRHRANCIGTLSFPIGQPATMWNIQLKYINKMFNLKTKKVKVPILDYRA